ncbi:MAG TPA: NUDIX domain-containing protein [Bryobacteraceae bacterium]|nr:NUDIX domain-containing protein [Bryobacteraceae bacterium]
MSRVYHKVGLAVVRDNTLLLCRKRNGSGLLILPGGCIEHGESHMDCLAREIREELGPGARVLSAQFAGSFEAPGADGGIVRVELYVGDLAGTLVASSEISELRWFSPTVDDWDQVAPSLASGIIPWLIRTGILPDKQQVPSGSVQRTEV